MLRMNARGGVWKWVLIVAAVLVLIACIGSFLGLRYLRHHARGLVAGAAMKGFEMQVEQNLPQGYDRTKVQEAFKGLEQGLNEGRVKPQALNQIGSEIRDALQGGKLTPEQMDKILNDIKKLSAPSAT
jgi:hypothetical protein